MSESYRDYQEVARTYNCSPSPVTRTLAWSDTTGGSVTLTTEVGVTAGFSVQALAELTATVTRTFAKQWSWESTFSDAPVTRVETTHSIVPSNPRPAVVTAVRPVFAD